MRNSTESTPSSLADWSQEQIALTKRWVETWKAAGKELERIERNELRQLDTFRTIALLCGPRDYSRPPYAPQPWSGLVEQQHWFTKAAHRERNHHRRS